MSCCAHADLLSVSLSLESMANPTACSLFLVTVDKEHIEATGASAVLRVALQILRGGAAQPGALGVGDACRRPAEVLMGTLAHFDENQR